MKERQRDRLVGAMILASLAAIFLPMLFDGAGVERRPMPPMPVSGDALTETVEALDLSSETWDFVAETDARRAHETPWWCPAGCEGLRVSRMRPGTR